MDKNSDWLSNEDIYDLAGYLYDSPIRLAIADLSGKILESADNKIMLEISKKVDVDVDQEELLKALKYDRDQFNKGFRAGWDALGTEIVRCRNCKHRPKGTGANHDLEFPDDLCPCSCEDYWYSWKPDDDWFCANGERESDYDDD